MFQNRLNLTRNLTSNPKLMSEHGFKSSKSSLEQHGIKGYTKAFWNLSPAELVEHSLAKEMGKLSHTGALAVETGTFTGRSPKDRFIVKDKHSANEVWWGNHNLSFDEEKFSALETKVKAYFEGKEVYVRDAFICADPSYKMSVRVINEYPWSNMFVYNMFLRPSEEDILHFDPEWTVVNAPGFLANPEIDGTRQSNFAILSFERKTILIGGTGYTGEIKKGIFSALNFLLPVHHGVLPMHCSANVGKEGDTALFFGLSGTGKTTLSADPNRKLIGDDEHGWIADSVFNFEGGCYAKTIDLTEEKEPDIFRAIKFGALLENIGFEANRVPDYTFKEITENTRVSYPIDHIDNIQPGSKGGAPKNIFYLTCDAYGILPPISKLTPGQAMYHFISGYTAKVAGTEAGITEPQTTFSACFGAPFMPLHPARYAEMLGAKIKAQNVRVWLINTGWSGGPYGVGERIKLRYTRAMITAALEGKLDGVEYHEHPIFGLAMPKSCPEVPNEILNPVDTWADKHAYGETAQKLANQFNANFEVFAEEAAEEIRQAAPKTTAKVE
jgi:phosphoenolpyruvate carboxykinase (ATP)